MCLAIPGKVVEVMDVEGIRMGRVQFGGIFKQVCLEYTDDAGAGDYVLVHVGFALSKIDAAEAERTYRILQEMNQLSELAEGESDPLFPIPAQEGDAS
jgi:hydrogenase expression/formation protein HypC